MTTKRNNSKKATSKRTTANAAAAKKRVAAKAKAKVEEQQNDEPKPITFAMAKRLMDLGVLSEKQVADGMEAGAIKSPRAAGANFLPSEIRADVAEIFAKAQRVNNEHANVVVQIRVTLVEGDEKKSRRVSEKMVS